MPVNTIQYPGCRLAYRDESSTPTCESPFARAFRARSSADRRPPVCGSEAIATVQPSSPGGHSEIPDVPPSVGDGSVLDVGTVANPPIAVTTAGSL